MLAMNNVRITRANKSRATSPVPVAEPVVTRDEDVYISATDQSATVEAGTSRKNLHGLRNKSHESSDRMPIHTMSEENFEVSDEMLVAAAARALTPDPVKPVMSKRGPKKGTRSKQSVESADLFQMPNPVPLMKKSSTILGTPRVQRPPTPDMGGYATTSGGYSMNRKSSMKTQLCRYRSLIGRLNNSGR